MLIGRILNIVMEYETFFKNAREAKIGTRRKKVSYPTDLAPSVRTLSSGNFPSYLAKEIDLIPYFDFQF